MQQILESSGPVGYNTFNVTNITERKGIVFMGVNEKIDRYGAKDVIEKKVSVLSVVGMIYSMCCAGAYGIEEMIPEGGPGLTIVMLLVLPFVWALPYCFICAELGAARPVEGGKLMWVKEALGEFWFGIMVLVNFFWGLIANTVYVVLAVSYLGTQIEMNSMQAYILKVGLIFAFFVVNVLGIKEVSWVSTTISIAVFTVFLLVAVVGFANYSQNPFEPFISPYYSDMPLMAVGASLGIGLWMYSGFDEISLVGGEVKGANKVIPKAILIVIPVMALTYILPTMAGLASVGKWDYWTTEPDGVGYHSVLALSSFAPGALAILFIIVAIMGQLSIYNVCIMAASRSAMILADENIGPKPLARLSSKRGMPVIALTVVVIVTTALLGTPNHQMEFTFLVLVDAFFAVIVCTLVVFSALILKRRIPAEEVPFKTPGGNVGHNIMAGCCLFFCVAFALLNGTDYYLGGLLIMLVIPIFYVICKRTWKGLTIKDPVLYPIDKRTGLGFGDVTRLGGYYLFFGLFSIFSRFFMQWYEEDTLLGYFAAPKDIGWYEMEIITEYPDMIFKADNGDFWIPGWYEQVYGSGLFSDFYAMLNVILFVGIAVTIIGLVLLFFGKRLKNNEGGDKK